MTSYFFQKYDEIDQSAEILQFLSDVCMNGEYADVTFVIGNTKILAHKMILSARSSYFKSLFGGGFAEAKQTEIKLNVPVNAFKAILKYIYTGRMLLSAFEWDELIEIHDLANQYEFDSLKKIISEYLTANLTLGNCIEIMNAAQEHVIDDLQSACLMFMDANSNELLGHDSFKELPLGSLCTLLKRDSFFVPEVDIFNAICKWYTSNPDVDIKEALSTVRWSELSSDDLVNVIFQSEVLGQVELLGLIKGSLNKTTSRIPSSVKDAGKNIATINYGATTISGENPSALLNGNYTNYDFNTGCTYSTMESLCIYDVNNRNQRLSSSIIVDLGVVKFINYIEMLLMDKDARSYSYYVDVSLDGKTYKRLFDYNQEYRRSWQYLYFETRPIRFIKLAGTRAFDITNKRDGWYNGYSGKYDYFDVVGLKAMYITTDIPKLIDSVIVPTKNVATVECGANVFQGIGGNNMLNMKMSDFTCHEKDSYILLQLNQPYVIDSLRMLLGNSLNQSNKYSFYIETTVNKTKWDMAVDKREEALSEWQEFDFTPRPAAYIKITGTQKDINFICTYFECPRNTQKRFKQPR